MHDEFVFIDQSELRQGERKLYASHVKSIAGLPHKLPDGFCEMISAQEFGVPVHLFKGA